MDSEHWISRLAAAKRFYAAQLGHGDRAGMEELDMNEEVRPEFACPYCYEDHDVASLCAHLEEEHPFEPHAALKFDRLLWNMKMNHALPVQSLFMSATPCDAECRDQSIH